MKLDYIKHKVLLSVEFLAVLFIILGIFLKIWWSSGHDDTLQNYGLWDRVLCTDGVCQLTTGESSGFLMFIRFAGVFGIILTICALLSTVVYLWKRNTFFNYVTGVFSIFNGCVTFLVMVVLMGEYLSISWAWTRARELVQTPDNEILCYNAVVIFFFVFSGIASMVSALFTLMKLDNAPEHKGSNSMKKVKEDIALVSMDVRR
ncbi:uncharacterized protein LOC110448449 [Mizuhopecten yessoensis]|uniref:Uncharacterized protein n=1 Tax=Mizuhopecten yessoensis TaxID=6573 RepID=A0A210QT95_MIZYE|nr:uncharacterized protein LOC110448449 [Mizuhopecten yessoensis]OWF51961.1 hypothetical protein KP79_PYT18463 [Mizuhopecten yessoensis]